MLGQFDERFREVEVLLRYELRPQLQNSRTPELQATVKHLGQQVYIPNRDEVGVLGNAFNDMSVELEKRFAELQETGQRLATVLEGMVDDVVNRGRFIARIEEQAERLYQLILDMLSLARIESGEQHFDISPVSVGAAPARPADSLGPASKHIRIDNVPRSAVEERRDVVRGELHQSQPRFYTRPRDVWRDQATRRCDQEVVVIRWLGTQDVNGSAAKRTCRECPGQRRFVNQSTASRVD